MEENVISIFWGPTFIVSDEFNSLVEKISTSEVEIREIIPASNFFEPPTLGEVTATFGPASDPEEAERLAIEAWNEGYFIQYDTFFGTNYCVFVDYTGQITKPPEATIPVTYNTVTVKNPDNNVEASFNVDIQMPTVTEAVYAWDDVYPSVTDAVYWDDMNLQVPVIIDIGGAAASHISDINSQGYAYINFTPTDIYPDDSEASDGINRDGVYTTLYPYNKDEYEYASGALMAWGWGAGQIISALEQPMADSTKTWGEVLHIDPSKTLVTGHSRYGKAAMFAAAFDERINICLASEPGGSGIQ
ncbi:MAG: hypothetical protein GX963_09715, partial [Bacteroidales bacterium]|nr:hypothetical protein [Bacteroidales bacterium]